MQHCHGPQLLEFEWFGRHNRIWWLHMGKQSSAWFPSHPAVISLPYPPSKRCSSKLKTCNDNSVWGANREDMFCFREGWLKQFPFVVEKPQPKPVHQCAIGMEGYCRMIQERKQNWAVGCEHHFRFWLNFFGSAVSDCDSRMWKS